MTLGDEELRAREFKRRRQLLKAETAEGSGVPVLEVSFIRGYTGRRSNASPRCTVVREVLRPTER